MISVNSTEKSSGRFVLEGKTFTKVHDERRSSSKTEKWEKEKTVLQETVKNSVLIPCPKLYYRKLYARNSVLSEEFKNFKNRLVEKSVL